MKDRLIWVLGQLNKVRDELNAVRDVGDITYKGARDELQDIINTYELPKAPEPIIVTQDQDDQILTLVRALHDKVDGMEDVLATLALAPATEPAPAPAA